MAPRIPPPTIGETSMAIRRMRAPWIEPNHSHVLWALASRLPDVYPTQEQLAEDTHMARSTVQYTLNELRAHGLVQFDGGKGKRRSYLLMLRAIRALDPDPPKAPEKMTAQRSTGTRDDRPAVNRDDRPAVKDDRPAVNAKSQTLSQKGRNPARPRVSQPPHQGQNGGVLRLQPCPPDPRLKPRPAPPKSPSTPSDEH